MPAASRAIVPPSPYLSIPLWLTRALAVLLPVWAAWHGKLSIFEVVWVYWVEGWLVLPFLLVRIGAARGTYDGEIFGTLDGVHGSAAELEYERARPASAGERLRMMLSLVIIRGGMLLFYLVFIFLFLFLQVTQREAMEQGIATIVFRNPWANSAWTAFLLAQTVEIGAHFFGNGVWRTASPRAWSSPFDRRTVLLHISVVSIVILHQFFFAGKDYATKGEVVYVALFGLLRLGIDGIAGRLSPLMQRREKQELPAEVG